jgi:hypothetical protein
VILDAAIAGLYGVETKALVQAVKRNLDRFPDDFMFQLTTEEASNLRYQIGTSSWGGRRYLPYAFTEQGVAMLSGVLRSERATQVNVEIMRAFVRLRRMVSQQVNLALKLDDLEQRTTSSLEWSSMPFGSSWPSRGRGARDRLRLGARKPGGCGRQPPRPVRGAGAIVSTFGCLPPRCRLFWSVAGEDAGGPREDARESGRHRLIYGGDRPVYGGDRRNLGRSEERSGETPGDSGVSPGIWGRQRKSWANRPKFRGLRPFFGANGG